MLESKSYIATPPGVTIQEQLDDRGMTQKKSAKRIDISEEYISKLIDGEVHLTPEMAEKLELVIVVRERYNQIFQPFFVPFVNEISFAEIDLGTSRLPDEFQVSPFFFPLFHLLDVALDHII